jgi:hypothetical protein
MFHVKHDDPDCLRNHIRLWNLPGDETRALGHCVQVIADDTPKAGNRTQAQAQAQGTTSDAVFLPA